MAHCEADAFHVAVQRLPPLMRKLDMVLEKLVGEERKSAKRGPAPKIQQQFEQIEALQKAKQSAIAKIIESMLQSNA